MNSDERGQIAILALGLALVIFAIAGLAVDGTRAFLARRSLQNLADAAALAGAGEVDTGAYYRSGGRIVILEQDAARRTAAAWLARRGFAVQAEIRTAPRRILVLLRSHTPTSFLALVGVTRIPVGAAASAAPLPGGA